MPNLSQKILNISQNATLGVRDSEINGEFYRKYLDDFTDLLSDTAHSRDPELLENIRDIVKAIYSVHEVMLDKPDQDQVYTERLKNYIESFIQHVQNHPGYLQQWTMQSILDALFNAQSETLGESVDEFIENSIAEIEAQLVMEEQKFALLTEEDSDDPNDDDHANEEMENVFKYPFADMRIEKKTDTPDNTRVDTESLRRSSSNASVSSEQSTNTAASFIELSEKFHNTMSQFQNQTLPKGIDKHGKKILETNIDQITRNMFDLYENCFQNGITQESINTFEKAFQSIISNWSYWSEKELSASSSPHIAQSLAKLTMNLYKITQEMHRNCQAEITPPGSPKGMWLGGQG